MRGAIAAGHPLTAEAGARSSPRAETRSTPASRPAFASWVAESPLTGPGAGGFMLVHRARDRTTRLLDFFVAAPGPRPRRRRPADDGVVDVDFDSETTQVVPRSARPRAPSRGRRRPRGGPPRLRVAALAAARRAGGRARPRRLRADAPAGATCTRSSTSILRHTAEGRRVYGRTARWSRATRSGCPTSRDTLERIAARRRGRALPRRARRGRSSRTCGRRAAVITPDDLRAYRVVRRRPVRRRFRGHEVLSNPPPSSGGVLIAYGLALLDAAPERARPGAPRRSPRSPR